MWRVVAISTFTFTLTYAEPDADDARRFCGSHVLVFDVGRPGRSEPDREIRHSDEFPCISH